MVTAFRGVVCAGGTSQRWSSRPGWVWTCSSSPRRPVHRVVFPGGVFP